MALSSWTVKSGHEAAKLPGAGSPDFAVVLVSRPHRNAA